MLMILGIYCVYIFVSVHRTFATENCQFTV